MALNPTHRESTLPRIKKLTPAKIIEELKRDSKSFSLGDVKDVVLKDRGIETIVSLEGLKSLRKLDITSNKLTRLQGLNFTKHLTWINAAHNQLTGEGLTDVKNLQELVTLNVSNNKIARIPMQTLQNLNLLKALILNNNNITSVDWIPKLKTLNVLVLSHNRIANIDSTMFERLNNLTKLSISHNLLKELPDISSLSALQELRVNNNEISTIKDSLRGNNDLKILDLGHNQIEDWEGIENLAGVRSLRQLTLKGNPICGQPIEDYIKQQTEQEGKTSNTLAKSAKDVEIGNEEGPDGNGEDAKKKYPKQIRALDAKWKQYNYKIKRLFPQLVVHNGRRVLEKRSHTVKLAKQAERGDDTHSTAEDTDGDKLNEKGTEMEHGSRRRQSTKETPSWKKQDIPQKNKGLGEKEDRNILSKSSPTEAILSRKHKLSNQRTKGEREKHPEPAESKEFQSKSKEKSRGWSSERKTQQEKSKVKGSLSVHNGNSKNQKAKRKRDAEIQSPGSGVIQKDDAQFFASPTNKKNKSDTRDQTGVETRQDGSTTGNHIPKNRKELTLDNSGIISVKISTKGEHKQKHKAGQKSTKLAAPRNTAIPLDPRSLAHMDTESIGTGTGGGWD